MGGQKWLLCPPPPPKMSKGETLKVFWLIEHTVLIKDDRHGARKRRLCKHPEQDTESFIYKVGKRLQSRILKRIDSVPKRKSFSLISAQNMFYIPRRITIHGTLS